MRIEEKILIKLILELRYAPALLYEEQRSHLFQPWLDDFTGLGLSEKTIVLRDEGKYFKIFAEMTRAGASIEEVSNFSFFRDKSSQYLKDILSAFEIKKLLRIGVRHYYIFPIGGDFNELNDLFLSRTQLVEMSSMLGIGNVDSGVALNYERDSKKINIMCGPVTGPEIKQRCDIDLITFELPEVALFLDVDYFSVEKKEHQVKSFIQEAHSESEKKADTIIEFFSGS